MKEPLPPGPTSATALPGSGMSSAKQTLALHALSQLNRQIADNPDFYSLLNLLLLTLCGQCSVADAFAVIHDPRSTEQGLLYFGTGGYEESPEIASYDEFKYVRERFAKGETVLRASELGLDNCPAEIYAKLRVQNVQLLLPLARDARFFGILGLGERPSRTPFSAADEEMVRLLVEAISPFMATLSREYFDLFHSVHQGVLVFDPAERLIRINATAKRVLEDSRRECPGAPALFGTPLDGLFTEPLFDGWAHQIRFGRSGARGRPVSGLVQRLPGEDRFFTARVSNINRRDDGQCDLLVVLEDVTEKTNNEQHLYELQRFAERGAMTSSITHELNNYLTMALGGTEMVQRQIAAGKQEKASATLEKLLTSLNQMKRFTAGLTDQARIQSKKSTASLNSIVFDLLSFVKVQRRFKNISIDLLLDPGLPSFTLDTDQVSQLLLNMLYNAADAIEEAKQEAGVIRIQTAAADGHVDLAIADNGCGMTDDVKARLFAEQITTKKHGHGFGLMMCGKIVKDHDGEIQIESEPGAGTTFHFMFPLSSADATTGETGHASVGRDAAGAKATPQNS